MTNEPQISEDHLFINLFAVRPVEVFENFLQHVSGIVSIESHATSLR